MYERARKLYYFRIETDDAFSTETGVEPGGIVGPVRCLMMLGSCTKIRNKKDQW